MRISVIGLGYVGAVSAACLAEDGHIVVGVDATRSKVALVARGVSPIVEASVGEMIESAVKEKRLSATTDLQAAVHDTELSLICVGTPSQLNGGLDTSYVRRVCEEIGEALKSKDAFHVVVIRSTILPGTMRSIVIPSLEEYSGKKAGVDFGVCNNPEFLREGTAVADFRAPPKTVVGEIDSRSGDLLLSLYKDLDAPVTRTSVEIAEMVKYVDNNWHALKVAFGNEVGALCKSLSLDSHAVMNIFFQDTKLNLSSYYLRPGFAFGGSCLPKDVRALNFKARSLDLDLPLLGAILPSNERHLERGLRMITEQNKRKVGILGFSFKPGTDDLRESPMIEVIERLLGKGYELMVYDRNVQIASLVGANRDYVLNHIPHIARIMADSIEKVVEFSELVVIGNGAKEFSPWAEKISTNGKQVVDLSRVVNVRSSGNYHGIAW